MQLIYIILFLTVFFFTKNIETVQNIPLIVENEDIILKKLVVEIKKKLPKNIDILVYDTEIMNGSEKLKNSINKKIKTILKGDTDNKYNIDFFSELNIAEVDISFLTTYEEEELLSYASSLKKDAVMLSSITILDGKNKKVWDKKLKKYVYKNIGLLQGNIFNTENRSPILRFSYFFLITE